LWFSYAHADSPPVSAHPVSEPSPSLLESIVFTKIDFDNNTLGEMVIKVNSMIREETKDEKEPTLLLNLKGLSQSEITKTLNRKVLNWPPMVKVPLGDTVCYIAQVTNCSLDYKGRDVIFTPIPPYTEYVFDVEAMRNLIRTTGHY
jgi:hypothetical protein